MQHIRRVNHDCYFYFRLASGPGWWREPRSKKATYWLVDTVTHHSWALVILQLKMSMRLELYSICWVQRRATGYLTFKILERISGCGYIIAMFTEESLVVAAKFQQYNPWGRPLDVANIFGQEDTVRWRFDHLNFERSNDDWWWKLNLRLNFVDPYGSHSPASSSLRFLWFVDLSNMDIFPEELHRLCKRFRVLIIGRRNAGKTTILEKMIGSEAGTAPEIRDEDGELVVRASLI